MDSHTIYGLPFGVKRRGKLVIKEYKQKSFYLIRALLSKTHKMKYVAYYRVSTKTQGDSGLGLESQRKAVERYIGEGNMLLATQVTEVESGTKSDRPMLSEAISLCISSGATLVIAKLDRLSRNAAFTFALMDSGVKFVAVDMPQANELTIGLMAVIAQDEAKRIASRTQQALLVIKDKISRGEQHISKSGNVVVKLGNPKNLTAKSREISMMVRKEKALNDNNNKRAYAYASNQRHLTLEKLAHLLNANSFRTSRGNKFHAASVSRLFRLYEDS